jgi:hypothetical protein
MAKYLRYALASVCFAASAGCLALWGWSYQQQITCQLMNATTHTFVEARGGYLTIFSLRMPRAGVDSFPYIHWTLEERPEVDRYMEIAIAEVGRFGVYRSSLHFPLWYPALIFALTGVGVLRLNRRFTLRSAIIATTVVAWLLGMAVIL